MHSSNIFGQQIGRYSLLEKIGEGGMAVVYTAFDSFLERSVALKMILPARIASSESLERFATEARALAQLSHRSIVKVLDYGEVDGAPFLVMDFMEGGTLKEHCGQPMDWALAAQILAPIARALEYIHRHQIIHRDIKPSNILMDGNDQPMLTDFGVVKLLETTEIELPAANVGIGTPEYMSPEQAMGKDVDLRCDMYALGVVFYELVTGQRPYSAESPMAVAIRHVTGTFPRPSCVVKRLPACVETVMLRAVAKDPDERFVDMGGFAAALEELSLGEKASVRRIRRILRQASGKRKHSRCQLLFWTLFLVLLACAAAAAWFFWAEIERSQAWQAVVNSFSFLRIFQPR